MKRLETFLISCAVVPMETFPSENKKQHAIVIAVTVTILHLLIYRTVSFYFTSNFVFLLLCWKNC